MASSSGVDSALSEVGSSGIVVWDAIAAGVGLRVGNPCPPQFGAHRAKLVAIATTMAIRLYSGSSSDAKRAPVLLVRQENERSLSSFW